MRKWPLALLLAVIIAGAILLGTAATIYFSPFQTCVRATVRQSQDLAAVRHWGYDDPALELQNAQMFCARRSN